MTSNTEHWLDANKKLVAEIIHGMADAIEKKFVANDPQLTGKETAQTIVGGMRDTAREFQK